MTMSSTLLIALEMSGTLGVVLVLGGWELWSLRRERARDSAREQARQISNNGQADPGS
jgi:hypothetical protein